MQIYSKVGGISNFTIVTLWGLLSESTVALDEITTLPGQLTFEEFQSCY